MAKNKYKTERVLGVIGGILGLASSIIFLVGGLLLVVSTLIGPIGAPSNNALTLILGIIFLLVGAWFTTLNVIIVLKSLSLKKGTNIRRKAMWIIIASVLAGVNVLGLIAGILALSKTNK